MSRLDDKNEFSDDDLLSELGIELAPVKAAGYTAKQERIISGLEEISTFYELNNRLPNSSPEADIFERLYAVRLEQIKNLSEEYNLLQDFDRYKLLTNESKEKFTIMELDDDDLLTELGIEAPNKQSIFNLQHVRSNTERAEAEFVARQKLCEDFEIFKPLFDQITKDLESGARYTERYGKNNILEKNNWFILDGQLAYIAEITDYFEMTDGHKDARLRLIYSNGTESNILMRSLTKSLYKDEAGRRILVSKNIGSLFSANNITQQEDTIEIKSGSIYVLRSLSDHPYIQENRPIIHKIGVTTGKVNQRITEARKDATYLLADVEVVATYSLPENVIPQKLEKLIHKVLQSSQLDITIEDRFGNPVKPKEWFLVPLKIIDEIVKHIKDGSIAGLHYDIENSRLVI